jgi:radical SAM superfamily enzyme YgiQ (UPF0313 family)
MSQNRIVLIQPPFFRLFKDTFSFYRYPLSLGYLAGTIKTETNWDVVSYNSDFSPQSTIGNDNITFSFQSGDGFNNYINNLNNVSAPIWKEIQTTLNKLKPTVVGISAMSQNFKSACIVAKIAKEANRDAVVILGGPHPSMVGSDVLNCKDIDIGVMGEGEQTIVELLDAIEKNKDLKGIKGTVFRANGKPAVNEPRALIPDLDSLCFPHDTAHEVLKDYDLYPKSSFGSIFASRGCPYSCTFCGSRKIWSQKVRLRSPQNVINEIKNLQKIGVTSLRFADDTFGLNMKWTEELCDGITTHCPDLKWKCEINVNLINDKILSLIKSAGCHMVELGVESGDNQILKTVKKGITIEQALDACKKVNVHGIELQAYMIAGFPEETEDSLQNTREAIKKIGGYIWFNTFSPFPGTELFEYCKNNGLIDETYDTSLLTYHNLDSYCKNISPQRFKEIVSEMMKEVDRKNSLNRIKRVFSSNTLWRIKELGIKNALKKGLRIFLSKGLINNKELSQSK